MKIQDIIRELSMQQDKRVEVLQIGKVGELDDAYYKINNIKFHAIDTNPMAVRIASNNTRAYCLNIEKDELPFDDNSLDYIFFYEIEQCENLRQVLLHLKRLLRPGGHLIIEGKNANHISVIESLIHGSMESNLLADCKRIYTTDDLYRMIISCGFGIPYLRWNYSPSFSTLTESQQRILDTIMSLPDAKDRNTYIHTSATIDAQKLSEVDYDKVSFKVMDNKQTLDFILQTHCSVARFGDGEFDIMAGNSIPYQDYNAKLADEMRQILGRQSDLRFMSCLPDVFENQERYTLACRDFWKGHLGHYNSLYNDVCRSSWYGSTFLSRPYIDLENKSQANGYFEKLRLLWENRDVLIVEGETSRSGVGNDLFANAASLSRIICPSRNAYDSIMEIENQIRIHGQGRLILLMLGPTAKVIAYHLYNEGLWLIDMGHIDSEYEWYKMGAQSKVKLSNKHTAEHNFDQNIIFDKDEAYELSIVSKISSDLS